MGDGSCYPLIFLLIKSFICGQFCFWRQIVLILLTAKQAMVKPANNRMSPLTWVLITAVGFIFFIGVAVVLIIFSSHTGNIKSQIYYFLLVLIGLVASGFLFGAFKSHAKYSGKVYNGTLELGGPTVVFIIVIYLGIKLASPPAVYTLRFTVFGTDKSQLIGKGVLKVLFDKPDSTQILNGTAEFSDVSTALQGKQITVIPEVDNYKTSAQTVSIPSNGSPAELYLMARADSITVSGMVINAAGQPVPKAVVMIDNGLYSCKTDDYGNFKAILPVREGTEMPVRVYRDGKLCYNNSQNLSAKISLTLQLH
jgi:hypothetical protein